MSVNVCVNMSEMLSAASSSSHDDSDQPPPSQIPQQSLFSSYDKRRSEARSTQGGLVAVSTITVTSTFVETMVSTASRTSGKEAWKLARAAEHCNIIRPLLEKICRVPASSVPVERVFSWSGIIVRPHGARIGDDLLSALVYLKYNRHI